MKGWKRSTWIQCIRVSFYCKGYNVTLIIETYDTIMIVVDFTRNNVDESYIFIGNILSLFILCVIWLFGWVALCLIWHHMYVAKWIRRVHSKFTNKFWSNECQLCQTHQNIYFLNVHNDPNFLGRSNQSEFLRVKSLIFPVHFETPVRLEALISINISSLIPV
jgi:hypothetical protein